MIEVQSVPRCPLCGREGEIAYRDLEDRLFGTSGKWSFRRCSFDSMWWLDPRPTPRSVPLIYENYWTHAAKSARPLRTKIWLALGRVLTNVPFTGLRDIGAAELMWLDRCEPGRLLDVGAGDGRFLVLMQARGWNVTGVEPDPLAAREAQSKGLNVIAGDLDAVPPAAKFDAVTLNNVLEHVPDPIRTLNRCWSLLAPGGRLVVLTPNVAGLGHQLFGMYWRGLEPPRHFHLFSCQTLRDIASRACAGAQNIRTTARAALIIALASSPQPRSAKARLQAALLFGREVIAGACAGEEVLLTVDNGL